MINYLLLGLHPVISSLQGIAQKEYTLKKQAPNVLMFSALTSLIAFFFFLFTSKFELMFDARLIPYAVAFGVSYASAWVGTIFALRYGSMAISSLIVSCSLIFPVGYGIVMGDQVTTVTVAGLLLLLAAFVLVNLRLGKKESFSLKWFGCVMVAFFGNGICSISMNMQKRAMGATFNHEFMLIALAVAFVLLAVTACINSQAIRRDFLAALPYASANGIANATINLIALILIGRIANTILYPSLAAMGMVCTFFVSFFFYRERFTKLQYLGYAMGIVSVTLLNL